MAKQEPYVDLKVRIPYAPVSFHLLCGQLDGDKPLDVHMFVKFGVLTLPKVDLDISLEELNDLTSVLAKIPGSVAKGVGSLVKRKR